MKKVFFFLLVGIIWLAGCSLDQTASPDQPASESQLKVLAAESFLADIAQNIAGDRADVDVLIPKGIDPHAFEPTPRDVARISDSSVFITNGAGLESWLDEVISNAGGDRLVIEASEGLSSRTPGPDELSDEHEGEADPHFWLDPLMVVKYAENIRDGLSQADPEGADEYARNADSYIQKLTALDGSIKKQIDTIPQERRLMVTNHDSFGYFADRYGLRVVGTIIPSVSSGASPSAQELARLVDHIRATGAPAVFLETGANAAMANQVAQETGVKVVTGLYSHSVSDPDGEAPSYIDMMEYNIRAVVEALK